MKEDSTGLSLKMGQVTAGRGGNLLAQLMSAPPVPVPLLARKNHSWGSLIMLPQAFLSQGQFKSS